jgi:hypothetical protein
LSESDSSIVGVSGEWDQKVLFGIEQEFLVPLIVVNIAHHLRLIFPAGGSETDTNRD